MFGKTDPVSTSLWLYTVIRVKLPPCEFILLLLNVHSLKDNLRRRQVQHCCILFLNCTNTGSFVFYLHHITIRNTGVVSV